MAKIVGKGTVIQQEIASVYTPVAQVLSIDHSGSKSESYDATALDSGVGKERDLTGYAEGGTVKLEVFLDPALAGHQAITDLITVPAKCNWKTIFTDGANTQATFRSASVTAGFKVAMNDGTKASYDLEVDGLFGWPS